MTGSYAYVNCKREREPGQKLSIALFYFDATRNGDPFAGDWVERFAESQPEILTDPVQAELALIATYPQGGVRRWVREFTTSQQPAGTSCEDWIHSLKRKAERVFEWAPSLMSSGHSDDRLGWLH